MRCFAAEGLHLRICSIRTCRMVTALTTRRVACEYPEDVPAQKHDSCAQWGTMSTQHLSPNEKPISNFSNSKLGLPTSRHMMPNMIVFKARDVMWCDKFWHFPLFFFSQGIFGRGEHHMMDAFSWQKTSVPRPSGFGLHVVWVYLDRLHTPLAECSYRTPPRHLRNW